ncbi:MAG: glycosyltransferase family 4 protein [Thermoanaerobaculia bacterium]|nr:glycosyltransferase family 4 protein [Thermoanaerobaculia bacterium]
MEAAEGTPRGLRGLCFRTGWVLRLLFLNQYFPPDEAATSQILGDLAGRAVECGYQTFAISSDRSYRDGRRTYPARENVAGVAVRRVRSTNFGRNSRVGRLLDYSSFVVGAAVRTLVGPKTDVIVGMSTPPILGAFAVIAGRLRGAKSVYWAMDVYPDLAFELGVMNPGRPVGRFFSWLSKKTLAEADLVIALGEAMAERLKRLGARNVIPVHNWADGGTIRPIPPCDSRIRQANGWNEKLVVLYSGNLGLAHEFSTIVAAARVLQDDDSLLFAFCGGGPRTAEIRDELKDSALRSIEFHSSVSRVDLGDLLAAGDVHLVTLQPRMSGLLVPSKTYGILAAGRPILYVGPADGEVHEIISAYGCGVSIRNGDVQALGGAIQAYRDDPGLREAHGRNARTAFDEHFTLEGQTSKILELIDQLVHQ